MPGQDWPPVARMKSMLDSPASGDKLGGQFGHAFSLEARGGEGGLIWLQGAVVAGERCTVGISRLELNGIGVTGGNNDGSPVIESGVEVDDGRFLAAMRST